MPYQILLVDDDSEFREEIRECLSQYRIIEASNGEEALRIIRKPHAIDLVLLDVLMPGLKGTEVLKEIKRLAPDLGVIILTGNSTQDIAIEALRGHADDFIEKPFDVEHFNSMIYKFLASRQKAGRTGESHRTGGKMERVKSFLKNNYDKKVSLKNVAEEVCLSPKYLSRVFKEKTGLGFNDYRLSIKMEVAQDLLKTNQTSVQTVADKLGYKNVESFVRIFKKMTGRTPTAYRSKPKGASNGRNKHST